MNVKVAQMLRPFNKGFSALQIKLVMNDLVYRYTQNIKSRIKCRVFKENNDYFIYTKVPSESNDEYPDSALIYYDVIIQLIPPNKASLAWDSIRDYDVKVFSNIPSFVFTFNYVYHRYRALLDMPSGYYSQRSLMEKAKMRNPLNLLGIDKSLWFTIYYCDDHKIFKRSNIDSFVEDKLNLITLLHDEKIMSQDRKLYECERREKHKRDLKEVEKKRNRRNAGRNKLVNKNIRDHELRPIFSDLASGLRTERFKSEVLKSDLSSGIYNEKIDKKNNKEVTTKDTPLKSNLKSGLKTK
jgi:hypothetical protein